MPAVIAELENTIQHYAWGSHRFLAELCGRPVPAPEPEAELWMGAHPKAPSRLHGEPLDEVIAREPEAMLGPDAAARFDGRLPFLFKLLAAGTPLSIQAHPNLDQAREGFARENAAGIPLDDPTRNYKDANHKPEIICALSEFWGLNGFRPVDDILAQLDAVGLSALAEPTEGLRAEPTQAGLRRFFTAVMALDAATQEGMIAALAATAADRRDERPEYHWICRGQEVFGNDVGLLCILLLNLVCLQPGQAMFCAAGDLHAYLGGFGVELMANSDNVLRGGCTVKHVDVPELERVLTFHARPAAILTPQDGVGGIGTYDTPVDEFVLRALTVDAGCQEAPPARRSAEILLCVEGEVQVQAPNQDAITLTPGRSVFVPAAVSGYTLGGRGRLYQAAVPETA